ncbi:hypothetical protein N9776_00860 [Pelagibacterales bacterium]|jgi:hypothetical protein|nr:hypothetical protein [Pelagibacterales bacterium]MDB4220274.1 hypothetical protein [Pelagibacterales bacterium]|tara:strand:+ start:3038 stop:3685 length:648 start_codon:yes stop_codon:yes gene_type:complete
MKLKNKLLATFSFLLISISISQANETFSNKISNFYGIETFPLLPGDYNFVFADEITHDGSFQSVENFSNSRPNSSIQGEIRTGNIDAYISDGNSISLYFAILQDGSTENDLRKTFYACNVVRDPTELISSSIEVFDDNTFVEFCAFKSPEFNFASYNYNFCTDKCVELQYTFFLTNMKDTSKEVLGELGMRIHNNLDRAFNGIYYDFNFVDTYLK